MKIGNIIYDSELINHDRVNYINYYDNIFDESIDYSLPTLFIGWVTLKNSFLNKTFNILEKEIIPNKQYWEFNFTENKASHVNGVIDFVELLPKRYFESKFKFENIDPVFSDIRNIEDLSCYIPEKISGIYNYMNESLYVLSGEKIYGFDLRMYKLFQFSIENIIEIFFSKTNNYIYDNDGSIFLTYYKLIPNYLNLRRYIVGFLIK